MSGDAEAVNHLVDHLFREVGGSLALDAYLRRASPTVEDAVQYALLQALQHWLTRACPATRTRGWCASHPTARSTL
jgi:hypothetical protein